MVSSIVEWKAHRTFSDIHNVLYKAYCQWYNLMRPSHIVRLAGLTQVKLEQGEAKWEEIMGTDKKCKAFKIRMVQRTFSSVSYAPSPSSSHSWFGGWWGPVTVFLDDFHRCLHFTFFVVCYIAVLPASSFPGKLHSICKEDNTPSERQPTSHVQPVDFGSSVCIFAVS